VTVQTDTRLSHARQTKQRTQWRHDQKINCAYAASHIPRDNQDDPLQNVRKGGVARDTWPPKIHLVDICTHWAPSSIVNVLVSVPVKEFKKCVNIWFDCGHWKNSLVIYKPLWWWQWWWNWLADFLWTAGIGVGDEGDRGTRALKNLGRIFFWQFSCKIWAFLVKYHVNSRSVATGVYGYIYPLQKNQSK